MPRCSSNRIRCPSAPSLFSILFCKIQPAYQTNHLTVRPDSLLRRGLKLIQPILIKEIGETVIESGRGDCGSLERAVEREWLVTNGIGGFASGTISDMNTRRYHGLLMAALYPPVGRTLLVAKVRS